MKKAILSIVGVYFFVVSSVLPLEVAIGQAVSGAVQGLLPLIEPILKSTVMVGIDHFKDLAEGNGCLFGCRVLAQPYCNTESGRSVCKGVCQKVQIVHGYTLRIRFSADKNRTEKWSLSACVMKTVNEIAKEEQSIFQKMRESVRKLRSASKEELAALEQEQKEFEARKQELKEERAIKLKGKEIENNIAIYSQHDLEMVIDLIEYQMAAEKIVSTGGASIKPSELQAAAKLGGPRTKEEAVLDATKLIHTIKTFLTTDLVTKFGPQ